MLPMNGWAKEISEIENLKTYHASEKHKSSGEKGTHSQTQTCTHKHAHTHTHTHSPPHTHTSMVGGTETRD